MSHRLSRSALHALLLASALTAPALVTACTDDADVIGVAPSSSTAADASPPRADGGAPDAATCPACQIVAGGAIIDYVVSGGSAYIANLVGAMAVPLDGGAPISFSSTQGNTIAIATNETSVFWGAYGPRALASAPRGGGPATMLEDSVGVADLTADEAHVYYASAPVVGSMAIASIPVDGGASTVLYPDAGIVTGLFHDPANVYFSDSDTTNGVVVSIPLDGGAATTIAQETDPVLFAIDGSRVYWLSLSSGAPTSVKAAPIAGGAAETLMTRPGLTSAALDLGYVYWTDTAAGTIVRTPLDGGADAVIAAGQTNPGQIVVNDANVFWVDGFSTAAILMTIAKPGGNRGTPRR